LVHVPSLIGVVMGPTALKLRGLPPIRAVS
jgi:hypothetical protein